MDNCCACMDSKEVDQAYKHEKAKAVYLSGYSTQQPVLVEHSTVLTRNFSQRKVMAYPPNSDSRHLQQRDVRISEYKQSNLRLRREIEGRKVHLWQRADYLQARSDLLKVKYTQKNVELQGLLGQINRYFG